MSVVRSKQVLVVLIILSISLFLSVHRSYSVDFIVNVSNQDLAPQEQHSFKHPQDTRLPPTSAINKPGTQQQSTTAPQNSVGLPARTKGQIGGVAKEPTPSITLKDGKKYISYLPYAGLTNQFIALQNAAYIARRLNRTLIIPPILANEHDKDKSNQPWSDYFDLARLKEKTGIEAVEWHEVRRMTLRQKLVGLEQSRIKNVPLAKWRALAQNLTCQVVYGYGDWENVHTTELSFLAQFLFRPVYKLPPPRKPDTVIYDRLEIGAKDNLHMEDIVDVDDLVDRYADSSDQLLFLSHTFKLKDPHPSGKRPWPEAGQHFYFSEKIVDYITRLVSACVGNPVKDYIAIHLRRGDVVLKCTNPSGGGKTIYECTPPLGWYAAEVDKARKLAGEPLPVIVTSDTKDQKELDTIAKLGWHRVDHNLLPTEYEIGAFGPAMVDSAILANARVFIGTFVSTMSRTAARRQKSWFNRNALYPRKAPPDWIPLGL